MKEVELGVREDLTGGGPLQADPPCNARVHQTDGIAVYDAIGKNNMKYMARVLGDAMMPVAHGHAFRSTIKSAHGDEGLYL